MQEKGRRAVWIYAREEGGTRGRRRGRKPRAGRLREAEFAGKRKIIGHFLGKEEEKTYLCTRNKDKDMKARNFYFGFYYYFYFSK